MWKVAGRHFKKARAKLCGVPCARRGCGGKQAGIDLSLVRTLAAQSPIPVTYAGGANSLGDKEAVQEAGQGRVHLTIGSALDLFGDEGDVVGAREARWRYSHAAYCVAKFISQPSLPTQAYLRQSRLGTSYAPRRP